MSSFPLISSVSVLTWFQFWYQVAPYLFLSDYMLIRRILCLLVVPHVNVFQTLAQASLLQFHLPFHVLIVCSRCSNDCRLASGHCRNSLQYFTTTTLSSVCFVQHSIPLQTVHHQVRRSDPNTDDAMLEMLLLNLKSKLGLKTAMLLELNPPFLKTHNETKTVWSNKWNRKNCHP